MSMTLISTFALSCYIIATLMQLKSVTSDKVYHSRAKLLGGLAAVLHGYAAIYGLLSGTGIDLGIYPMLSLITLSIILVKSDSFNLIFFILTCFINKYFIFIL